MMQAYAEGWELLEKVDLVDNVTEVFRSWREGTVIRSWLLDLLVAALDEDAQPRRDPRLRRGLRRGPVDRRGRRSTTPSPMPAIAAALFARFVSRQDDSPGDEGGRGDAQPVRRPRRAHRAAARRRRTELDSGLTALYVSHLTLHDFRSYADVDVAPRAGGHRVHRPQRAGQDQPGRGDRLPLPAGLAPGRDRRAAGARRRRPGAWSGPRSCATGARAVLEVEINPGRANRARVNRSPLPRARELLGLVRTVVFSPEDLTLVKGDPSDRRRFLDDLLVLRTPRLAGVRADYDRVLRQRNSLLKTAGAARRGSSSRGVGALDARRLGRPPRPDRRRAARRAARAWSTRCGRTSARPTRPSPAARRREDAEIEYQPVVRARRRTDRDRRSTDAAARRGRAPAQRRARPRHLPGRPAPRRPACSRSATASSPAAGEGLRLPRRVLVVRARAAAGVVRPAARRRRRPDPDPGRRVRRARHRAPRAARRRWSPAPSRCWSPRRSAADVPAALAGRPVRRRRRGGDAVDRRA